MTVQPKNRIKDEQLLVIFVHRSISNIHPFSTKFIYKTENNSTEQHVQIDTFKKKKLSFIQGFFHKVWIKSKSARIPVLGKPRAFDASLTPYGKEFDVKQGPSGRAIYYQEEQQSGRLRNSFLGKFLLLRRIPF